MDCIREALSFCVCIEAVLIEDVQRVNQQSQEAQAGSLSVFQTLSVLMKALCKVARLPLHMPKRQGCFQVISAPCEP